VSPGEQAILTYKEEQETYLTFEKPSLQDIGALNPIAYYQFLERKMETRRRSDSLNLANLDTTQAFQTHYSNTFTNAYLDSLFRSKTEIFTNLSYSNAQAETGYRSEFMDITRTKIVPYRWQFSIFESSFDVSNEILFDGLDSYAAEGGTYRRAPTGLL